METETKPKIDVTKVVITVLLVLLTAGAVGAGVYYVLNENFKKEREASAESEKALQEQIDALNKVVAKKTSTQEDTIISNVFDVMNVKIGDKVANMTVTGVGKALEDSPLEFGKENAKVSFSGRTTLTGTYAYIGDDQPAMINDFLTFQVEPASIKYLPIINGDQRNNFTFSNATEAKKLFGITTGKSSSGNATVVIDNYSFVIFPGEGSNSATLISKN